MNLLIKKRLQVIFFIATACVVYFFIWEIYIPKSQTETIITYDVKRGLGVKEIAVDLQQKGIIKNSLWFRVYVDMTGKRSNLQAGKYTLSQSMSVAQIVKKFVEGDIMKEKVTIIEGWDLRDIAEYLEAKDLMTQKDFLELTAKDWNGEFDFLESKPKRLNLEGYLFPDTYEFSIGQKPEAFIATLLSYFGEQLTPELRQEIVRQKKSIFKIVTMASMIEKEVRSLEDKKIVSGILWKRIEAGIPLQVDATVNYITRKNNPGVAILDTKIDSPYNTYKYYGLPLGPISNPGLDSIMATIYPTKTDYWYYLSADRTGKTIFSKTLEEHNLARGRYLK